MWQNSVAEEGAKGIQTKNMGQLLKSEGCLFLYLHSQGVHLKVYE